MKRTILKSMMVVVTMLGAFYIGLFAHPSLATATSAVSILNKLLPGTTQCTGTPQCPNGELCECNGTPCPGAGQTCCLVPGQPCSTGGGTDPCCTNTGAASCNNETNTSQYECCVQDTLVSTQQLQVAPWWKVVFSYPPPGLNVPLRCSTDSDCCPASVGLMGQSAICTNAYNTLMGVGNSYTYCIVGVTSGTSIPNNGVTGCAGCENNDCNVCNGGASNCCCVPDDGTSPCTTISSGAGKGLSNCCQDTANNPNNPNLLCGPKGVCCEPGGNVCDPNKHDCCSGSCVKDTGDNIYHCSNCTNL
jgi:hypothetical protein